MKKGCVHRLCLIFSMFIVCQQMSAQTVVDIAKYTDFLPAPPNASAIAKHAAINLNKNTGSPQVSVPLFTVKGNKLSTTLSLSYASTGLKVDEIASRVGMGWAVNMGGVISRTVRGVPDEQRPRAIPWTTFGWEWGTYTFAAQIIKANNVQGLDGEPDLFSFNFNGYSGSFVLDPSLNIIQTSRSDLRFEKNFSGTDWNFKITTPDGVQYYFGGTSATEKTRRTSNCGKTFDAYLANAWYLKKAVHPNGESILFTYEPHDYSYQTGVAQTAYWVNPTPLIACPMGSACPTPPISTCVNSVHTQGVLLTSIVATGRMRADIRYGGRQDCTDSLVSRIILTDLTRNGGAGAFEMEYMNVEATGPQGEYGYGFNNTPFLIALRERSADSQMVKTHRFSYINPALRAPRLSFSQDHWGYYNGKNNATLVPKPDDKISTGGPLQVARFPAASGNREPDAAFAQLGMLSKVDYPTGGYDSIVYEGNVARDAVFVKPLHRLSAQVSGSGVNTLIEDTSVFTIDQDQLISLAYTCVDKTGNASFDSTHNKGKVTILNPTGGPVFEQWLVPGSSGSLHPVDAIPAGTYRLVVSAYGAVVNTQTVLEYRPESEKILQNVPFGGMRVSALFTGTKSEKPMEKRFYYASLDALDKSSMGNYKRPSYISNINSEKVCADNWSQRCEASNLFSNSLLNLNDYQSGLASYESVVEAMGSGFEGGATETRYYVQSDGVGDVLFGYDFLNSTLTNYSAALNGKVREETIYKKISSGFLPAKKTSNSYKLDTRGFQQIYGYCINGRNGLYPDNSDAGFDTTNYQPVFPGATPLYIECLMPLDIIRYKVLCEWVYADSTTETIYDENGLNPLTNTTRYYYDTSAHSQPTRIETKSSKGELLKSVFLYPADFGGIAVYDTMIQKNQLVPVEMANYNNGIETQRQKTHFADWGGGNIAPSFFEKSFNGNVLSGDGSIDAYDSYGNVLQFTGKDGIVNSIVWGYNYTYPVAKVVGATYAQALSALSVSVSQLQSMDSTMLLTALEPLRAALPGALVTTYAYQPPAGVTTIVDPNNQKSSFEYDGFLRLKHTRDNDGNLLRKMEYSYAGPDSNTGMLLYKNSMASGTFSCTACLPGYSTGSINYIVPEGKYSSLVSQMYADSLAAADVLLNGQAYANRESICARADLHVYYSAAVSATFTKNNCTAGAVPAIVTYTVPAFTYSSTTSQSQADGYASADVIANGQAYANANGTCSFYSAEKSGYFTRNNCAAGGTPSGVTYTVPANAYISTISQDDADMKAQNDVNVNGQNYANSITTCTFYSAAQSATFTKNNCVGGATGSSLAFSVPAGLYSSVVSQAEADANAQNDLQVNGQANANANGKCVFYNIAKSGTYWKNNCTSGKLGEPVVYTVSAGQYSSIVSQADADSKAQNEVYALGQEYANITGSCVYYNTRLYVRSRKNNCTTGRGTAVRLIVEANTFSSTVSQSDAQNKAQAYLYANIQTYANAVGLCGTYFNQPIGSSFVKNDCDSGATVGSNDVTYDVGSNEFTSDISEADAQAKAQAFLNSQGQAFANATGYCNYSNRPAYANFQKNDCSSGIGTVFFYVISPNTYTSTVSQAEADGKAMYYLNRDGQLYANANGSCHFYSGPLSGVFTKNNCPSGGTGSSITFNLPEGAYASTVSKADADSIALNDFPRAGQDYANQYASCTFYNTTQTATFQKNNCASASGTYVAFTVGAGIYSSTISQSDANNKALAYANANGQAYANANGGCVFYSVAKSGVFTKSDCVAGATPSGVTYTVPANAYTSATSQADADAKAQNDINVNGQAYANANGSCIFYSVARSAIFKRNNCAIGGTPSSVVYNVPANAFNSTISQADADNKAQNDVNANGQSYANANGSCTFLSAARSASFTKNNCAPGGTPSTVQYSVGANAYTSNISQADADEKAQNDVNANGQAYANAYGYCTFYNAIKSDPFVKNNCAAGGTGSQVTYTVAAGTYISHSSQADADNLAQNDVNSNGQAYANSSGFCTFYNISRTAVFYKSDCAAGGTGSAVNYTVAAQAYTSTISQADADSKAQDEINANGQNYANSQGYCTFYNAARSVSFTKNNSGVGGVGSTVTYTVQEGTYSSTISQADADSKAQDRINSDGQVYANANGSCIYYSTPQTLNFTKTNCAAGGIGSSVSYTLGANAFTSNVSQADANAQAVAYLNLTGEGYANANGYCTFYSAAKSQAFQKNDCGTGGTGSWVTYHVAAEAYTSTISQSDADNKAQADIDANGQAYANSNGYCTYYNVYLSQSFQKNDCGDGNTGSLVSFSVSAGMFSSTASQQVADDLANAYLQNNGQGYANAQGNCIFYNAAITESFTKECGAGYIGSTVSYTVAAGTFSSTVSQHDAQLQARNKVNADGQAYANANGTCTYMCSTGNCSGVDKKCVANVCETGVKVYTNSEQLGPHYYSCTFHYEWSDGSWSQDYTEDSLYSCQ